MEAQSSCKTVALTQVNSTSCKTVALIKENSTSCKTVALTKENSNVEKTSKGPKVLPEEAYIESLEKIIQKDFFPDLPKLKAQTEYLEALEKNDVVRLREIQIKYCPRTPTSRIGTSVSTLFNTPSTFETPLTEAGHSSTSPTKTSGTQSSSKNEEHTKKEKTSLDDFLARHTSEDNASFTTIMKESVKKHRLKYPWLHHSEDEEKSKVQDSLALPSAEQQAALKNQPRGELTLWSYKNQNMLMYVPEGAPLTREECLELEENRHEVQHRNTRFESAPFNETANKEALAEAASIQAKSLEGKIGIDGKEIISKDSPKINGYGFVPSTPSPAPGILDSPLMTWGEIEGTPFRLDGSDTPLPQTPGGPQFKMPDVPSRERLALTLADRAAKHHRTKKEQALQRVQSILSPSPQHGMSSPKTPVEKLSTLSAAAQHLACAKLGIQRSTDKALLASYSPSPSRNTSLRDRTPGNTPTPRQTPTSKSKRVPSSLDSLTDNLLNLPKRQRAEDFF